MDKPEFDAMIGSFREGASEVGADPDCICRDEHDIEGVPVRVTNVARTVADCFKYRNKIGLDVAIEALRDCLRRRKATMDELWDAAKVCRMSKVMRPYLEALA